MAHEDRLPEGDAVGLGAGVVVDGVGGRLKLVGAGAQPRNVVGALLLVGVARVVVAAVRVVGDRLLLGRKGSVRGGVERRGAVAGEGALGPVARLGARCADVAVDRRARCATTGAAAATSQPGGDHVRVLDQHRFGRLSALVGERGLPALEGRRPAETRGA
jgi:hypothetical protein